jgi:hypothetical protein
MMMMMMIGPVWKEPATGLLGAASIGRRDRRATTSRSRGPDVAAAGASPPASAVGAGGGVVPAALHLLI